MAAKASSSTTTEESTADLDVCANGLSLLKLTEDREFRKELSKEEKEKREAWKKMQEELKQKLIQEDGPDVLEWREGQNMFKNLQHVAGVDISFDKEHEGRACAMMVVLSFPDLQVRHVSNAMVEMKEPYIPGFLAFREVDFLVDRLKELQEKQPDLMPQAIMVDGNGILHPRGFGLACHLGVLIGIPTVGVGKKLYHVDGLEKGPAHKERITKELKKKGDHFILRGDSGQAWGAALRTSDDAPNPVYVSVGHMISLEMAVLLTQACSIKRVPEPIRQADLQSRKVVRILKPS